jgi:DNA-binding LacI/PurR family transcriptional regulator
MGRLAAMMLMDDLANSTKEQFLAMQLTPSLVIRDTVAPPAKK